LRIHAGRTVRFRRVSCAAVPAAAPGDGFCLLCHVSNGGDRIT